MNDIYLDWKSIDTVFLDMDGTLLDLHFDNYFWMEHLPKRYSEIFNISYDKAQKSLAQHSDATQGTLHWYCLDHWSKTFDLDIVALKHEVAHKINIRKNVLPFLQFLKDQEKRIVLLTNAHSKSVELKFGYVEMNHFFDEIITSHSIGLAKEEKGFWEALTQVNSFTKANSLFIDDSFEVLHNANLFGISNLISISRPDSCKPIKTSGFYTMLDDYQQIMI